MADDTKLNAALFAIEHAALDAECADPSDTIRFSIAISLKRIADALDGTTLGVDMTRSLAGLAMLHERTS